MSVYIRSVQNLINEFRKLPSIGPKTAKRIVYFLLRTSKKDVELFARSLLELKEKVKFCSNCYNLSEQDLCSICLDQSRDRKKICVVASASDVEVIESTGEFRGLYHVLGGLLSPIEDIGPQEIRLPQLVKRIDKEGIQELIIALNPTVEGESTSMYIKKILASKGIKITRLASGLPVGGDLEYTDEITLGRAIANRGEF